MKKGFSLIETVLYITLLSLILLGIFSSLLLYLQSKISREAISEGNYESLIANFHEE